MKKTDLLEIHFRSFKEFKKEVLNAAEKRQAVIQPKSIIYFDSVEGFRNFMTVQRVEILTVIYHCKPKSIYELAKIVDRDFAAVSRDCTGLKTIGFIKLIETMNAKGSKKPVLSFPYERILVHFPHSHYQIEFKQAA